MMAHAEVIMIPLANLDGTQGYRITKLELMPKKFGAATDELRSTVKLYTTKETAATQEINFDDSSLIGAAVIGMDTNVELYPLNMGATFDAIPFNQDVYITHHNDHGDAKEVNVYFELEQFDLTSLEASTLCLKNMRKSVA